jgi:iron complex outermembrane receptor protein
LEVTPALSLVGGLRFDYQDWTRVELATPAGGRTTRIDHPVNWRLGGVYEVWPNANVYGQYSVATDRGAWIAEATVEQMAMEPTRGRQVEFGIKQSLSGGRVEWTVAGYRIRKTDLLMFNRSPTFEPGEIREDYLQVGSQSSRGVEATVTFDTGGGFRLSANGTVLDPQFDEFYEDVDGVPTSRNGNRPFNVPWQSANLMATWAFHTNWLAQGALRFVGERYIDTANTLSLPSYTVVDAGLRWSVTSRVAIDMRVGNVFDEFYPFNFAGNGRGGGNWLAGSPRSFELSLTAGL